MPPPGAVPPGVAARALAAFETLRDLAPLRRTAALAALEDPEVRAEVGRLLAADAGPGTVPTPSPTQLEGWLATPEVDDLTGLSVGACRIERRLAEGGMGRVYLARQEPAGRRVAVKILRQALPDEVARRRFDEELRVLAAIEHPGVSRIYEAGTWRTPSGEELPYFAMELVEDARSVTRFADDEGLDLPARVRLVQRVAEAVTIIHGKGVIHRDLKPGNVLVGRDGRPVVIDFGIARAAGSDPRGVTRTGAFLGTPAYMAPEQVLGRPEDVDVRTDVHALGAILYELLAGSVPRDVGGGSPAEVVDAMRRGAVAPLRTRAPQVPRDLRAVVETALAAEPARRYASAAAFAEDLERWSTSRPVLARPSSPLRAGALFVRRHRALTAVSATLAAAVVAAVVLLAAAARRETRLREQESAQRGRAEDLLRRSRDLVPWLLAEHGRSVAALPNGRPALAGLATGVRRHLEGLRLDEVEDPDVLLMAARSYLHLAQLGMDGGIYGTGAYREAMADADAAERLGARIEARRGGPEAPAVRADASLRLAALWWGRGDPGRARVALDASGEAAERARRAGDARTRRSMDLLTVSTELLRARIAQSSAEPGAQRAAADRALASLRRLDEEERDSGSAVEALPLRLRASVVLAFVTSRDPTEEAGPAAAALDELARWVDAAAARGPAAEVRAEHYRALVIGARGAEDAGRPDALALLRRAGPALEAWAALVPDDLEPVRERAALDFRLGYQLLIRGEPGASLEANERAIAAMRRLLEREAGDRVTWVNELLTTGNAAECLLRLGRPEAADAYVERGRAIVQEIERRFPTDGYPPLARGNQALVEATLAELRAGTPEHARPDARARWEQARDLRARAIAELEQARRDGRPDLGGSIEDGRLGLARAEERLRALAR